MWSSHSIQRIFKFSGIILILLILLPLMSCSDDDDSPTGPQLPEGIYYNSANGHYYEPVTAGLTWSAARDSAEASTYEQFTGHLAVVNSEQENLFLYNNLGRDVQRYFLGGFQDNDSPDYLEPDGGWIWCTGDECSYTNWAPGEPNGGMGENYLAFIWGDQPVWNDVPHSWNVVAGFIIEYE